MNGQILDRKEAKGSYSTPSASIHLLNRPRALPPRKNGLFAVLRKWKPCAGCFSGGHRSARNFFTKAKPASEIFKMLAERSEAMAAVA